MKPWESPDPYSGLMVNPPGPPCESVQLPSFFDEPTEELEFGPGGIVTGSHKPKQRHCYWCNALTGRRALLDAYVTTTPPNNTVLSFAMRAECGRCSKRIWDADQALAEWSRGELIA